LARGDRPAAGFEDVTGLLLAKGLDVNARNNKGETPLHVAMRFAQKNVVEVLLAKGADVNARDREGKTPLRRALAEGNKFMADLLDEHGVKE
jgi:cytohesin